MNVIHKEIDSLIKIFIFYIHNNFDKNVNSSIVFNSKGSWVPTR